MVGGNWSDKRTPGALLLLENGISKMFSCVWGCSWSLKSMLCNYFPHYVEHITVVPHSSTSCVPLDFDFVSGQDGPQSLTHQHLELLFHPHTDHRGMLIFENRWWVNSDLKQATLLYMTLVIQSCISFRESAKPEILLEFTRSNLTLLDY